MKKRMVYSLFTTAEGTFINLHRSVLDRQEFVGEVCPLTPGVLTSCTVPARHPEVRRINRRIEAGEEITFPVAI